jgi:hypothetical protein
MISTVQTAWEILNAAVYDLEVGDPADGINAVEEALSMLEKLIEESAAS